MGRVSPSMSRSTRQAVQLVAVGLVLLVVVAAYLLIRGGEGERQDPGQYDPHGIVTVPPGGRRVGAPGTFPTRSGSHPSKTGGHRCLKKR